MAFLEKLGSLAKNAAEKTGDLVEISKLGAKINESKNKIAAHKTQIGEHYWAKYESGETLDAEVMEFCAAIRAENEAIEEFNGVIQKIKAVPPPAQANMPAGNPGATLCASCGAAIPDGKRFCPECGTPTAPPQPTPEPESVPCPSCGRPVSMGKKFCPECGAAIAAPEPGVPVEVMPVAVRCSSCGGELTEDKKFCPECGSPVPAR